MRRGNIPYQHFGQRLHDIRMRAQESLPEVSGAVELESDEVSRFERGETRPSEDVLQLLINHFEIKDDEADELWDLAGYAEQGQPVAEESNPIPTLVVVPVDNRIIYTDTANVMVNNYGVVINFMQNAGNNQPIAVAKVGMSLEHAKSVLEVLTVTIAQAEAAKKPRMLAAPKQRRPNKNNSSNI